MSLRLLVLVALGGALGSVARFVVADVMQRTLGRGFPYGTLTVNVLGSFIIGVVAVLLIERGTADAAWRALIIVGFLGGFTTFSSFSLDTLNLLRDGGAGPALANIAGNLILSLTACAAGLLLTRSLT